MADRIDNLPLDNTGRLVTFETIDKAFAATVAATISQQVTYLEVASLTGAITLNLTVTDSKRIDEITCVFTGDGSSRVITMGTGTKASGTITIGAAVKQAVWKGTFDGTNFVETSVTTDVG